VEHKDHSTYDRNYYAGCNNEYRKYLRFQVFAFLRAVYIKRVFNPKTVLDVGCGMGNLVEALRKLGIESHGIEVSDYALSQIPRECRGYCRKGSILEIPFADKEFDLVVSCSVLEHIPPDQISQAIRECARVAGQAMLHEIAVLENKRVIHKDPTHVSKFNRLWWAQELQSELNGWQVREARIPILQNGVLVCRR